LHMNWTRGQTIGRGSTATVSMAKASESGQVFAVKSAYLSQSKSLQREQEFISTLRCPQIVTYKGCNISIEDGKLMYNLLFEYAPAGTLVDVIREHGGRLDDAMIRSYTRAVLLGLEYLHANGIVHCDIKGPNILVTSDGVKIADLGCAKRVTEGSSPIAGTPVYMAPEVARGEQQGFPSDVWALGCTVIEMVTGRAPWVGVFDPVSALYMIGFSGNVPEIPSFLSRHAKDFLSKCLKRDPVERWSASELLKHDFVNSSHLDTHTPTGVLDHDLLWDSTKDLDTTWNPVTHQSYSLSPLQRIRQLSEGDESTASKVPNWAWDRNWVTVRSDGIKESSHERDPLCANALTTARTSDKETSFVNEEDRASGISKCNTSCTSCRFKVNSLMSCICKNGLFYRDNKQKTFCFMRFQFLYNLVIRFLFIIRVKAQVLWTNSSTHGVYHVICKLGLIQQQIVIYGN
ncbi:Pkinase domain-containing protein, partial [Cephalotus follicularis]